MKENIIKNKKYIIIGLIIFILMLSIVSIVLYLKVPKEEKFALSSIYSVYPEEIQEIYSNMVFVSCYGDWHLDIPVDNAKKVNIQDIKKNLLIDYVFSYMDKNNLLNDNITVEDFVKTSDLLFFNELDLVGLIDDYIYKDYMYTVKEGTITRTNTKCVSDKQYVSHLIGYSFNKKELSVDVKIGYMDKDILFDFNDKKLGKYDGDPAKLGNMFTYSPYYRFNYVSVDGKYKLNTVEFNVVY